MPEPVIAARLPAKMQLAPGTYHWCACGKSKNQPFCDGSHAGSGFTPVEFVVTNPTAAALCQCKHSKHGHNCDGSHKFLPQS